MNAFTRAQTFIIFSFVLLFGGTFMTAQTVVRSQENGDTAGEASVASSTKKEDASNKEAEEEYIDLLPVLKDLYIDPEQYLKPIKRVEVCYD